MARKWYRAVPFVILALLLAILPPAQQAAHASTPKVSAGSFRAEELALANPVPTASADVALLASDTSPSSAKSASETIQSPPNGDPWLALIGLAIIITTKIIVAVVAIEVIQKQEQAKVADKTFSFAERRNKQPSEISVDLSDKARVTVKDKEKEGQAESQGKLTIKNFTPQRSQVTGAGNSLNSPEQASTMEISAELKAAGEVLCTDGESQVESSIEVPAQLLPDPAQGIEAGDVVTVGVQLDIGQLQLINGEVISSALQSTATSIELAMRLEQAGVTQEFSFTVSSENNVLQPSSGNINLGTFDATNGQIATPVAVNKLTISDTGLSGASITVDTTPIGGGSVTITEGVNFVAGSGAEQIAVDIAAALNAAPLFSLFLVAEGLDGIVYVDAKEGGSDKNQVMTSATDPHLAWSTSTLVAGIDGPVFGSTFSLPPTLATFEFQNVEVGVPFTLENTIKVTGSGSDSTSPPSPYSSCATTTQTTHVSAFRAESVPGQVSLEWETASEVDLTGFHVYRTPVAGGETVRITDVLIPATGSAETGASYQLTDRPGPGRYVYELELTPDEGAPLRQGQVKVEVPADELLRLPLLQRS